MARLSDVIEEFIKELFDDNGSNNELQIQRNELADKFSCAPSQIQDLQMKKVILLKAEEVAADILL